ncbi:hypothetical protein HPP92_022967 [Vanilla planifolia]|uniref:Uncharacterized protein n=1 Tax=Vanilla planifolia TaxID=51239 RepID=A0A835PYF7_VANPL|nr:hypothetical protein HPP92_022967 [Vanilla planifolia]
MTEEQKEASNPNPRNAMQAFHFLRALARLRTAASSASLGRRCRAIRRAAYTLHGWGLRPPANLEPRGASPRCSAGEPRAMLAGRTVSGNRGRRMSSGDSFRAERPWISARCSRRRRTSSIGSVLRRLHMENSIEEDLEEMHTEQRVQISFI